MSTHSTIVVGVVPEQPADVLRTAAELATRFDAKLECLAVESPSVAISGMEGALIAPGGYSEIDDEVRAELAAALQQQVATALDGIPVEWTATAATGIPSEVLAEAAERVGAIMIVVGTREAGLRGTLHEFVNGSVAAQLAHHQHRPVLVVPLHPAAMGRRSAG